MKQAFTFIALLMFASYGVAAELTFGKEVTLPDGTRIISKVVNVDDPKLIAESEYFVELRKMDKAANSNMKTRPLPPVFPTALTEIVVLQRTGKTEVKLWGYMLPRLSEEDLRNPRTVRPRAIFLIPSTGRLLLIWQRDRMLWARELEKGVVYEKQPQSAQDFHLMRSPDGFQSIGALTENAAGELDARITVDGKPVRLKRSGSTWQVVE